MRGNGIKVLLIYANSSMDNLIPLGVSLLSACLKEAGHKVKLFDTTFYKTREETGDDARVKTLQVKYTNLIDFGISPKKTDMVEDFKKIVDKFKPELVAVSVVEITYLIGLRLLNAIKDLKIITIMGGIYVTFSPKEVIKEPAVDMICIGEGEEAIVELSNRIKDKKDYINVKNLWVKKEGKIYKNPVRTLVDLNKLPMQDWAIYEKKRFFKPMGGRIYIAGSVEMNRGCPYRCSFCCNEGLQKIYGKQAHYYRHKDIEVLMKEIKIKKKQYNLEYLYIVAENFLLMSDERFNKFIEHYREIRLPFWIETRPEPVTEEKLIKLNAVGCEGVSIGVEHGNEEFREKILNRYVKNEDIVKAFEITKKLGIRSCANDIIGFPTETRELVFETIKLNRRLDMDNVIVNIFNPYNGTKLRELSIQKGYLSRDNLARDYRSDTILNMPQLTREDLIGLQRTFAMYVKFSKDMWDEIKKCEKFDNEGNKKFEELSKIYKEKFLGGYKNE